MAEFTKAQKRAIESNGKTLLVSAAAGSGKTTTLIERILRSVTRSEDPVPLDRLLIVTFTKAAASELRLRISRALSDALAANGSDPVLARQMTLLPSAKISTIDSFCLDLVRENHAALGLSPTFRIADEGEATLLATETMERLIDECYDADDPAWIGGADRFAELVGLLLGTGSDRGLCDLLLGLYEKLAAFPEGARALFACEDELRRFANGDFFASPYGARIEKELTDIFRYYKEAYKYARDILDANGALAKAYGAAFDEDYAGILRVCDALCTGYAAGRDAIAGISFARLGSFRGEKTADVEFVKDLRAKYKKDVADLFAGFLAADPDEVRACMLATANVCHSLGELLSVYEKRAEAEKKRQNLCDFSDLSRYALRLLVDENGEDTPLALAQKEAYDAVYIDEYQDVNAVQDRIFRAIATKTNRFMVGDIKQSIYAFRGASPAIFAGLRRAYPDITKDDSQSHATVFMSENFRCNREIIDFTNRLFDKLMPLISPGTGYQADDALVFKKNRASDTPTPVRVVLVEQPPKDAPRPGESAEAVWIAEEIRRLTDGSVLKDNGEPIACGDVAILLRAMSGRADVLARSLRARGIPVFADTSEDLLAQSEVAVLADLLYTVDNPRRDIPLCGVLLSPLCGITPDCLAVLRCHRSEERLYDTLRAFAEGDAPNDADKQKAARFLAELADLRRRARFLSAGELVDEICTEYAIPARLCGKDPLRRANIQRFRDVAYGFAGGAPKRLSEFLRYLKNVEKDGKAHLLAAKPSAVSGGAVRIMSIHASKGLEYPVVFLANAAKRYNLQDATGSLLYSPDAGLGIKLRDESGFCVYDNLLRKSVALSIESKAKEEELRLFYVALTRARERLYLTAEVKDPEKLLAEKALQSRFLTDYAARSETDYLSLALLAAHGEDMPEAQIVKVPYTGAAKADRVPIAEESRASETTAPADAAESVLAERFDRVYAHKARTRIPAKLSVSRLYPDILDDTVLASVIAEKRLPAVTAAPRFLSEQTDSAADRGTATHLFLQFFDFENAAKNGAAAELSRMTERRFLTAADAARVNLAEIERFLASNLFTEMRSADRIYREQRFNLELPAADFAEGTKLRRALAEEHVLVQGVIDCFFYDKNGGIVLVDYKTDRLPRDRDAACAKIRAAHTRQLSYYAKAIAEICGKPPARCLIYALCLGDTVEITPEP